MQLALCGLEAAKLLKELKFNADCVDYYWTRGDNKWLKGESEEGPCDFNYNHQYISRPTLALAAMWLREVYDLHVHPELTFCLWGYAISRVSDGVKLIALTGPFNTHDEALEAGIQKAIDIIKNKSASNPTDERSVATDD